MARAIHGSTIGPQEMPNQHSNNQTDIPKIPIPRNGYPHEPLPSMQLFSMKASERDIHDADHYIDVSMKTADSLKIGSFLIGLLERLHTVPPEFSAEDSDTRDQAIHDLEQLLIDYEVFAHPSGKGYDTARFSREVTDAIGEETIDQYPLVTLLAQAVQRIRATGNRSAESVLVTAQRITLLGIAKQRGVYNPRKYT